MKNEMNAWLRNGRKNNAFVERLSEISPNAEIDFKIGDKVSYTNDFGVVFHNLTITAIGCKHELWTYGNCIYLDKESYWYPVKPESLKLES
jgi:hypothetical protein